MDYRIERACIVKTVWSPLALPPPPQSDGSPDLLIKEACGMRTTRRRGWERFWRRFREKLERTDYRDDNTITDMWQSVHCALICCALHSCCGCGSPSLLSLLSLLSLPSLPNALCSSARVRTSELRTGLSLLTAHRTLPCCCVLLPFVPQSSGLVWTLHCAADEKLVCANMHGSKVYPTMSLFFAM